MTANEVLRVLDALAAAGIAAGMTGGWGVDALIGHQRRDHKDVDLGLDANHVDAAIGVLGGIGYALIKDERPARLELVSESGRVDLHPIAWDERGNGLQTGFGSERFHYPAGSLDAPGMINGRAVRCGTPELQVQFHLGYQPSEVDRADMAGLAEQFGLRLPAPYSHAPSNPRQDLG